jgi:hypothetical protein
MAHTAKLVLFFLARTFGLFALCRWLTRRCVRIICYHGGSIGDERLFNGKLFCTGQHVRGRLQWLKQAGFSPLTLGEAVDAINLSP